MIYKFLLITYLIILFSYNKSSATHTLGGTITYKAIKEFTYEISLTVYTDSRVILADRPDVTLNLGDGNIVLVARTSQRSISKFVLENTYITNHKYKAAGDYLLSFSESSRNKSIANISNNSNQPFYIESMIVVQSGTCRNSSPQITIPPVFYVAANSKIIQAFNTYDADGDSITIEMITPHKAHSELINGYSLPANLELKDEKIIWRTENNVNSYALATIIKEYRHGKLIGYVMRDWMTTCVQTEFAAGLVSDCLQNDTLVCFFDATQSAVNFDVTLKGIKPGDGEIELFAPDLKIMGSQPVTLHTENADGDVTLNFSWRPDSQQISSQILRFVFRGYSKTNFYIQTDELVKILPKGTKKAACVDSDSLAKNSNQDPGHIFFYPNPVTSKAYIKIVNYNQQLECKIYNSLGQYLAPQKGTEGIIEIDVFSLPAGVYIYHLSGLNQTFCTGKFVVQK